MKRRLRGRGAAAGVAVLVVAGVVALVATRMVGGGQAVPTHRRSVVVATTTRTNVIVILTDDQRWDTLWSMPNVQKLLVKHGVTFTNSFVSDSLCCPSRATILTGNYAHTTGVWDNHPPNGGAPAFREHGDEKSTIATWLHAAGYDTGLFGKYLNSYGGGVPPGWDRWVAFDYEPAYRPYRVFTNTPGACPAGKTACRLPHTVPTYSTTYFGDAATSFIDTAPASKPVFVYYAPYAPHRPSTPQMRYVNRFANLPQYHPPSYNEADVSDKPPWIRRLPRFDAVEGEQIYAERQAEYQSLVTVDNEVGRIVASLKATHRLAHTVILFSSDNGIDWGEHRLSIGSKQVPYDEALRVPLVVRYEPATTKGFKDSHLIVNVDWASTLADIAGARHPATEGRSFLPLIERKPLATPWRTEFLLEHMAGNPPSLAPSFCGIRSTGYMYTLYSGGFQELYDLKTDPYELRNIASNPAQASLVRHMRALALEQCQPPPPRFHP
jgi:N-acetylglucosamine-6-sulfatase